VTFPPKQRYNLLVLKQCTVFRRSPSLSSALVRYGWLSVRLPSFHSTSRSSCILLSATHWCTLLQGRRVYALFHPNVTQTPSDQSLTYTHPGERCPLPLCFVNVALADHIPTSIQVRFFQDWASIAWLQSVTVMCECSSVLGRTCPLRGYRMCWTRRHMRQKPQQQLVSTASRALSVG
jgi:hypothetical protein